MAYRGPLTRAVATALAARVGDGRDTGAVALARRYAQLIDDAAPAAKYREPLERLEHAVKLLSMVAEDSALVDRAERALAKVQAERALAKVQDALAAHSVASDLGPKLLAALGALGLTPAARSAKGGVEGGDARAGDPRAETEFERLRRERAERARQHGPTAVDPPAS